MEQTPKLKYKQKDFSSNSDSDEEISPKKKSLKT